jgi:chromate transporter
MTAGVSAVIISVVWDMASGIVKGRDGILILVMVLAFLLNYIWKINAIFIILGTVLVGVIRTMYMVRHEKTEACDKKEEEK